MIEVIHWQLGTSGIGSIRAHIRHTYGWEEIKIKINIYCLLKAKTVTGMCSLTVVYPGTGTVDHETCLQVWCVTVI